MDLTGLDRRPIPPPMSKALKVAVVGVTGAVGQEMLRVLEERRFSRRAGPRGSPRSAGRSITFGGTEHTVRALSPSVFEGVDLALFSAGGSTSREFGPVAAAAGALVVDNSSAFRMDPDCPLCVPEVNLEACRSPKKGIIANPNCSTIQMVVALKPVHELGGLKRVVVATYQAISGAGAQAIEAFHKQIADVAAGHDPSGLRETQRTARAKPPHALDTRSSERVPEEELKMVHETKKISGDPSIQVSPTTVRVPVVSGHSEAITVETHRPVRVRCPRRARGDERRGRARRFRERRLPQPKGLRRQGPRLRRPHSRGRGQPGRNPDVGRRGQSPEGRRHQRRAGRRGRAALTRDVRILGVFRPDTLSFTRSIPPD